jgi:hypothetical protein
MGETEPNGDMPVWVRVLYRYGIPGFLALVLVWFLVSSVSDSQAAIQHTLDSHAQQSQQNDAIIKFYLRQLCINTAKDDGRNCDFPQDAR